MEKPDSCTCSDEQRARTMLCWCGWKQEIEVPRIHYPDRYAGRDKSRMKEDWDRWNATERDLYMYWFSLAKPHEDRPLDASRFAAWKVEQTLMRGGAL